MDPIPISAASSADIPAITEIYNHVIATSTAVFSDRAVSEDDRLEWLESRRARPGPQNVAESHRRQGLGRRLVEALVEHAGHAGLHVVVAGVDADNAASLALHESLGFERVGHLREVAWKFDRWIDLVLLERTLS
jgi:L-amino acid N-acyltransferase YncA